MKPKQPPQPAWAQRPQPKAGHAPGQAQFRDLRASSMFCPRCRMAMPIRERLLLVLLDGELHELLCARCGTSLGTKQVSARQPVQLLK